MATDTFFITGDEAADRLLAEDALALLIGMLLDQQVPMETAFRGPQKLHDRLGELDAHRIATMPAEEFQAVAKQKPGIHRFAGSMATRIQALCEHLVEHYDGDAEAVWRDAASGEELLARLVALPGFGDEKARIFLAVLGKRLGVRPPGWEEAAAPFSDDTPRSVADITSPETLAEVRAWKKQQKAAGKSKAE